MHRIRTALLLVTLALPTGAPRVGGQEAPPAMEERQLRAAIRLNPEYDRLLRGTELEGEIAGREAGEGWAGWIVRGLTALFAAALTLAGLALLFPIIAALFLLLVVAPVAALRQGRR